MRQYIYTQITKLMTPEQSNIYNLVFPGMGEPAHWVVNVTYLSSANN
jgi:adenine C2-methylase RlmN of 23S rRNA A2503 and tRNA A37